MADKRSMFIVDEEADLASIPEGAVPGSIAKLDDGSKEWVMSPSGNWVEQINEGGDEPQPEPQGDAPKSFLVRLYRDTWESDATPTELFAALDNDARTRVVFFDTQNSAYYIPVSFYQGYDESSIVFVFLPKHQFY